MRDDMRKPLLSCAAAASVLVLGILVPLDSASANSGNEADISSDFRCSVLNASRSGTVSGDSVTRSVVTNSRNDATILKCVIDGVPNSTGRAVRFSGFRCNTFKGSTLNSFQVISAGGVASLTCKVLHR
jgi:hypothetical protein